MVKHFENKSVNQTEKTILVIDDSVDNQDLIKIILMSKGYKVHCASNGQEALVLLAELPMLPNLILLDVQMPIMDGYQFRSEQLTNLRLRTIPVIVMTADDEPTVLLKMKQPFRILQKPLDINSIVETVSKYI